MEHKGLSLDLRDRKLIYFLDFRAREPYTVLAKKLQISKQATEYRLSKLMEKEVIRGFYPVINAPKLGYLYCRLCFILQKTTEEKEREIIEHLKKDPRFFWVITSQGLFDVLTAVWARTLSEFRTAVDDFLAKYGEYIKERKESVATDVIHYQHRYLLERAETEEIHLKETTERSILDERDQQILKMLCENARTPLVNIAHRLHISAKTVANKIRRMEKEEIIQGYRPIIDHNKLGYGYYKLWINMQPGETKEIGAVHSYLKKNPAVLYIVRGISLIEDLDVEIMVKDNKELFDFMKNLRARFPKIVGDYKSMMFEDTKKVRYLPF